MALGALALVPVTGGQGTEPYVLDDPPRDPGLMVNFQTVPILVADHIDILQFRIDEPTPASIRFAWTIASWEPLVNGPVERQFALRFRFADSDFQLVLPTYECAGKGRLSSQTGASSQFRLVSCVDLVEDHASAIIAAEFPKRLLRSSVGVTPAIGDAIVGLSLQAVDLALGFAADYAPDITFPMPTGAPPYTITSGDLRKGPSSLTTETPIRFTNGEATTLVYRVAINNTGAGQEAFILAAEHVSTRFSVRLPARLSLEPAESVVFPVLVTIPFGHQHGALEEFTVVATPMQDSASRSELTLGVEWLQVPQPAAHHNVLFFHSQTRDGVGTPARAVPIGGQNGPLWMNPLDTDPSAASDDGPAAPTGVESISASGSVPPSATVRNAAHWRIPLDPQLQIGLDFDVGQPVTLQGRINFGPQTGSATISANLCLKYGAANKTPELAAVGQCAGAGRQGNYAAIASAQLPAQAVTNRAMSFTLSMPLETVADFIAFNKTRELWLDVSAVVDTPLGLPSMTYETLPYWVTDASTLVLPLNEYHETAGQEFLGVGDLAWQVEEDATRKANPGDQVVVNLRIANEGTIPREVRIANEGVGAEWATIRDSQVMLGPGSNESVSIVIEIPSDVAPGSRADFLVVAEDSDQPNIVALQRVVIEVIAQSEQDVASDANPQAARGSPMVGSLAIVAAILVATRCRREK